MTDAVPQQGDISAMEASQKAAPLPGPTPVSADQGVRESQGVKPGQSLLFRPSDMPGQDVMSGVQRPAQTAMTANEAAFVLGEIIRELGEVSPGLLAMHQALRKEAMATDSPPVDFSRLLQGEGPHL